MIVARRLLLLAAMVLLPRAVGAADLSISPSNDRLEVGSTIITTLQVDTDGVAVNAVETTVTFPPELLKLVAVSKAGSILSLATVDSAEANSTGRMTVAGGLPSPGYSGSAGVILTVTWQARAAGKAVIGLENGKVLANDGVGTTVLQGQTGATYLITDQVSSSAVVAPVPGSLDYQDQQRWHSSPTATIYWSQPSGMTGVSYIVSQDPTTSPDTIVETTDGSVTVSLPSDGVWYFHIRGQFPAGWSESARFTLRRDATQPEPFMIEVVRDRGAADPSPQLIFSTTDLTSGVAEYMVSVDGGVPAPATSPLQVAVTRAGEYEVIVTATDVAGHSRSSSTTFSVTGYAVPVITSLSSRLILLGQLTVAGTALAGDRVNIFVDGELLGSTTAGQPTLAVTDGTIVRLPWTYTTAQALNPGPHRVTVTATSPSGQTSVASDPRVVEVQGSRIQFGDRTVATFAAVPLFGLFLVLIMATITWLIWQMRHSLVVFRQRQVLVDQEVQALRRAVKDGRVTTSDLDQALSTIDDDVVGRRPSRVGRRGRKG